MSFMDGPLSVFIYYSSNMRSSIIYQHLTIPTEKLIFALLLLYYLYRVTV